MFKGLKGLEKVLSLVGVLIFLIGTSAYAQTEKETYKIGVILPLTGNLAFFGQENKRGMELAVKDINARGGINGKELVLLAQDNGAEPKQSISALRKLVSEGVCIIVTALSNVCLSVIPVTEKENILLFANAAHPAITGESELVLRHSNTGPQEARVLSHFLLHSLKSKKVLIFVTNDDYGIALRDAFVKELSDNVEVIDWVYDKKKRDFKTDVLKIIKEKPDAVFVQGYGSKLGLLIKRLREYGFKGKLLTSIGFMALPGAMEVAGEAATGVIYDDFDFDTSNTSFKKLTEKYQARYNSQIRSNAVLEYNTILLLAEAIKHSGYDSRKIREYILRLGSFRGVGEQMEIAKTGDILPRLRIRVYNK